MPGLYFWAGLTALALTGFSFWFALLWPLCWIATGLFLASAVVVLYLASRPSVEIYESHVKIGHHAIPWRHIRRLDRSANLPLMVRLTLADKTRILVIYPGDPELVQRLAPQLAPAFSRSFDRRRALPPVLGRSHRRRGREKAVARRRAIRSCSPTMKPKWSACSRG